MLIYTLLDLSKDVRYSYYFYLFIYWFIHIYTYFITSALFTFPIITITNMNLINFKESNLFSFIDMKNTMNFSLLLSKKSISESL